MNFLVLSLTCIFCKSAVRHKKLRMALAAVSGALLQTGLVLFLPYVFAVIAAALILVPGMLVLAFGRETKNQGIMRLLCSWLSIVLLNGVATAVYNLTGVASLYLYTALVTAVVTYVLVRSMVTSVRRQKTQISLVLYHAGVSVSCIGLYDSGNRLMMPHSGEPVHIAEAALLKKLIDGNTVQKKIPYRALGNSEGELLVYCLDGMKVQTQPHTVCDKKGVWMGCAEDALLQGKSYQVILNAAVLEP